MALHREIYWVGKQWAVTGFGIQACNQRQKGQFDIEAPRLWEDGVQDAIRAEKWVNADDFEKAIAVARKYFPEPPRKARPPEKPIAAEKPITPVEHKPAPVPETPPKPLAPKFDMRVEGLGAKLTPVWRIRTRVGLPVDNR
jgi:hypothetical protein